MVASGGDFIEARASVELGIAAIVGAIEHLGPRVALSKTEATTFVVGKRNNFPHELVSVGRVQVTVRQNIKYLGITLDCVLSFRDHFRLVLSKA